MLKLISATPSPYARKVRIALAEKGVRFELLTEVPWDHTTATPRHNPLEKLPVLILEDGSSVYESSYILQYLELKFPQVPLVPRDADGWLAARKLEVLCDGVCDAVVLSMFEKMREKMRPNGGSPEWLARQRRKIEGGVGEMAKLVGTRTWAVGEGFGLGDIAVGTALGYIDVRFTELPWRKMYPNLGAFSDRIEMRQSFRDTVPYAQAITDKVV
jgi:glutathione S-transferase